MTLLTCKTHGMYAAGFGVCPECSLPREHLTTPDSGVTREVSVKRMKRGRKRKGDGSLDAQPTPEPTPKTIVTLLKTETKTRIVGIDTILAKLVAVGMDTNSKIIEGLQTGRVVQTIGWEKTYLRVIDYLADEGYNVAKYRFRIVCGSLAA